MIPDAIRANEDNLSSGRYVMEKVFYVCKYLSTLPTKILYGNPSTRCKTTLIRCCVGGQWVDPATFNIRTFFLCPFQQKNSSGIINNFIT